MKKSELLKVLKNKNVPSTSYSLEGIKDGECLCLLEKKGKWQVVYNSRGNIISIADFQTESEACDFIYNEMKRQYKW
jgi:hypothetical protein